MNAETKPTETKPAEAPAPAAKPEEKKPEAAKFAEAPMPAAPPAAVPAIPGAPPAPKEGESLPKQHAMVLKTAIDMLQRLLGEEEGEDEKPGGKDGKGDKPAAPPTAAGPKAPPAVPSVPSYSAEALAEIARLTAENAALKRTTEKTDAQRADEAVARFRAKNLVHDEASFRATVARLKLAGEQIDAYAAEHEKHLLPAPPLPGTGLGGAAGTAPAALDAEAKAFLSGSQDLKEFAAETPELQVVAFKAARAWDASEQLKRITRQRTDWVRGQVAGVKHKLTR